MVQVDMFDLIDEGFCFDQDINNIVDMLDEIAEKYEMVTKTEKEWEIWDHVSHLGYRLSYTLYFNYMLPNQIYEEIEKVTKYAQERKIKVEPLIGHVFSDDTGCMYITSIYLDERRKIK